MPAIPVAVVGLGAVAGEHLEKLRWMAGVEVVGVCDLQPTLSRAVADRFDVPHAFTDYAAMVAELRPAVVHVLTPPQAHRSLVLGALNAGAHVLVEKPITPTWDEYVELRDTAVRAGCLLVENYNYRFMDVVLEGLELLADGAIGRPVTLDVAMSVGVADPAGPYADRDLPHFAHELPGGALMNFASHPASLAVAALGGFDGVRAWRRRVNPCALGEDELRAVLSGPGVGATLTLTSSAQPSAFTLRVRGTEGTLDVDVYNRLLAKGSKGAGLAKLTDGMRRAAHEVACTAVLASRFATGRHDYFEGLGTLLRGFYSAVADGGTSPVPVGEMDATNRLVRDLFDPDNQL